VTLANQLNLVIRVPAKGTVPVNWSEGVEAFDDPNERLLGTTHEFHARARRCLLAAVGTRDDAQ
jgi:hypothetical protein